MSNLRRLRRAAGMTQTELAKRAGVSRQLVGAVEAGRHLPRVDSALALAAALDADAARVFAPDSQPLDVASGVVPGDGVSVRTGRVGDQMVTAPARMGPDGWDVADGIVEGGFVTSFEPAATGFVVAGCEPGLELAERILRERGMGAVAAMTSSRAAIAALSAGRVHAAVVHGPALQSRPEDDGLDIEQIHLARWRVGLAAPPDFGPGWWQESLSGHNPVVQREDGAGVQRAFEEAVGRAGVVGPRASGHYESAQRGVLTGMAAVTIEPAALAVGALFHPIEVHEAQLWLDRKWRDDAAVMAALDVFGSQRFQRRLRSVGGYDLVGIGTRVT